jgi:hypothetical protein
MLPWVILFALAFIQPVNGTQDQPPATPPQQSADPVVAQESSTDPLTDAEERLQGQWQAYAYGTEFKHYEISFDKRQYRADGEAGDWYTGRIDVRDESEPAQLDFVIEDCECKYKGMTSLSIFRWEGAYMVMAGPEPGADRPEDFDESSGDMMELRRLEETDGTHSKD